jgi:hypothetical protein
VENQESLYIFSAFVCSLTIPSGKANVPYENVPYENVPYDNVPYDNVPYDNVSRVLSGSMIYFNIIPKMIRFWERVTAHRTVF